MLQHVAVFAVQLKPVTVMYYVWQFDRQHVFRVRWRAVVVEVQFVSPAYGARLQFREPLQSLLVGRRAAVIRRVPVARRCSQRHELNLKT